MSLIEGVNNQIKLATKNVSQQIEALENGITKIKADSLAKAQKCTHGLSKTSRNS